MATSLTGSVPRGLFQHGVGDEGRGVPRPAAHVVACVPYTWSPPPCACVRRASAVASLQTACTLPQQILLQT
eukprot:5678221-Alexandrium_andersonii.AAC.1